MGYTLLMPLEALQKERLKKLKNIKSLGINAYPSKKRISNESPLGEALLGTKTGETVEVTAPIIKYKCKVLEIK